MTAIKKKMTSTSGRNSINAYVSVLLLLLLIVLLIQHCLSLITGEKELMAMFTILIGAIIISILWASCNIIPAVYAIYTNIIMCIGPKFSDNPKLAEERYIAYEPIIADCIDQPEESTTSSSMNLLEIGMPLPTIGQTESHHPTIVSNITNEQEIDPINTAMNRDKEWIKNAQDFCCKTNIACSNLYIIKLLLSSIAEWAKDKSNKNSGEGCPTLAAYTFLCLNKGALTINGAKIIIPENHLKYDILKKVFVGLIGCRATFNMYINGYGTPSKKYHDKYLEIIKDINVTYKVNIKLDNNLEKRIYKK